ncbi:hypothetical protein OGAPHI_005868 [Ogataea philodendri]|uniref:Uncharacterized protein n=1 Tax=Ogataea philodendri TaxID=1378263 RepID=A0A9P8T2D6_9ASCO|nr:uncharacterized protein OGAPHI_005868 [Ogataea philodendri]KAH3662616.1 hypothetical protein OGAPHI_005868 [Ogataea philodendri]
MAGELAQRRGSRVALVQFQKHSKNLVTNSRLLVGHQPSQVPDIHTFKEELRILVDPVAKLSDTLLADLRVGVSISVSKCCVEDILEKSFQIVFVFHFGFFELEARPNGYSWETCFSNIAWISAIVSLEESALTTSCWATRVTHPQDLNTRLTISLIASYLSSWNWSSQEAASSATADSALLKASNR